MTALNSLTIHSNGRPFTSTDSDNDEVNHWRQAMGTLNVRHRLGDGSTVSLDLDHLRYHNDNPTVYLNTTTDAASGQVTSAMSNSGKITPLRIFVAKADYLQRALSNWKLGGGLKAAFSRFTNDPTFVSSVQNEWVGDAGMGAKSYLCSLHINDMAPFLYFIDPYTFLTGSTTLQPAITNTVKADVTCKSRTSTVPACLRLKSFRISRLQGIAIASSSSGILTDGASERNRQLASTMSSRPLSYCVASLHLISSSLGRSVVTAGAFQ